MTSRCLRQIARLARRTTCQPSLAFQSPTEYLPQQISQSRRAASLGSELAGSCRNATVFAAEASPPEIKKPSGEEIGHDSPYEKPKAGEVAEGNASEIPWDPEHVNIGNECDKILLHSAEVNGVAGILKEVETHGMTFNDNNIATAFEQLALQRKDLSDEAARSEIFDTAAFKQLVDMATEETGNFNPRQLADIVASLGTLKFQDAELLGGLIARTARKVGEMDPEHLSKLSDGLAGSTAAGLSDLYKAISKKM